MFVVKSVMNSRIFVVFFVIEHFLQLIKAQRRFCYMKSIFEQIGGTYTKQGDYRLPNLYFTTRGRTPYRRLRPAPAAILEATPQNPVLQSAHFRQTTFPPRRCRGRSTIPHFSAGKRIRRKGRCHGTAQIRRPNEVGAKDE